MTDSEGQSRPPTTPGDVWESIDERGEFSMDITFTPDQLCAMARARERESIVSRRILLTMLIGLAAAFAYNTVSVDQLWVRLSQGWMLAWTCFLGWRFRRRPEPVRAAESCASFLRREFEGKRRALLEIRGFMFLLVPPILAAFWGGGPAARLRNLGVDPSSRLYGFATGLWPFVTTGLLLVLVWFALGFAAKKARRELDEVRRRSRE